MATSIHDKDFYRRMLVHSWWAYAVILAKERGYNLPTPDFDKLSADDIDAMVLYVASLGFIPE